MSSSKVLFYLCLSFVLGVFLASVFHFTLISLLILAIIGLFFISIFWGRKKVVVFGFCLIFLFLGSLRFNIVEDKNKKSQLIKYIASKEELTITGKIVQEPDLRPGSAKLYVQPEKINSDVLYDGAKILITAPRYPEFKYGEEIKVSGKLESPPVFDDFNYKDYLRNQGVLAVVYWPKIEKIGSCNLSFWEKVYREILNFKKNLREKISQNLSPPHSSILSAMILGDTSDLSSELKNKLNITGTRHIIAISGMHIVILTSILMSLLLFLGFWRSQAFYFSIVLMVLFIAMTGFHSSAVRAGIMAGLLLFSQKLGRQSRSSRSIMIAAALMLFSNPKLLTGDIGFQLSFLAALGIVHSSIIKNWLRFIPEKFFSELKSILTMTISAQVFTLPILVYNFGNAPLFSLLTNILVLPFVYWIMLLGFLMVFLGLIWQGLAWILMAPVWLLLSYFLKMVEVFSQPWAVLTLENIHWIWLAIFYLGLALFVRRMKKKAALGFLEY